MTLEYVGANYAGFQRQPGKETVQTTLERAIAAVTGEPVTVVGSGRTDAGAHALGQVVAFSTRSSLATGSLRRAINAHLPFDVAVTEADEVRPDFHPRYDAVGRTYRYLIWNRPVRSPLWHGRAAHVGRPLDVQQMDTAVRLLHGEHDFGAFVPSSLPAHRTRVVYAAQCRRDGPMVAIEIEANGFMRQMIRSIVGTLIDVGSGRSSVADFADILSSRDRRRAGRTAPSCGLYLVAVRYETGLVPTNDGSAAESARPF